MKYSELYGRAAVAGLLVAAGLGLSPAFAQGGLETITVTANRVETNEQKTPVAMSVISEKDLNVGGVTDANFLQQRVPNIQVVDTGNGAAQIAIRGVVSTNNSEAGDPAVAFNFDGIYQGRPQQVGGAYMDAQRIEVLLGPQGTLYGRNATSGVINVVSNKPILGDFHASGAIDVGNYSALTGQFVANIPVSDTIAARFAFLSNTHQGYYDPNPPDPFFAFDRGQPSSTTNFNNPACHVQNTTSTEVPNCANTTGNQMPSPSQLDQFYGRLHVLWEPGDDLSVLFTGNYSLIRGVSPGGGVILPVGTAGRNVRAGRIYTMFPYLNNLDYNLALHVDYKTAIGTLSYIGAYDNYQAMNTTGGTASFPPTNAPGQYGYSMQRAGQVSQELRLAGDVGPLTYQGGIYYYTEQQEKNCNCGVTLFAFPSVLDTTKAVYGQVTYAVLPELRLTGGARYNWDHKSRRGETRTLVPVTTGLPELQCSADNPYNCLLQGTSTVAATGRAFAAQSWEKLTYHVGIDYDVIENVMLYGSLSTGFKQGGYFDGLPTQPGGNSYGPENVQSWEVGVKSRFFDDTLQLNASAFRYLYTGFQVTYVCNDVTICTPLGLFGVTQTINAQKATPQGVELQAVWAPTPSDTLTFDVAYLDAKYKTFNFPNNGTEPLSGRNSFSGGQMAFAPKWQFNVSLEHVFDFDDGSSLKAYVHTHFQSTTQLDYRQYAVSKQPSWEQSDFNLTYSEPDNRWDLMFYVRNLENNWHLVSGSPSGGLSAAQAASIGVTGAVPAGTYGSGTVSLPRMLGLRLSARY